jgi:hypothetical protein
VLALPALFALFSAVLSAMKTTLRLPLSRERDRFPANLQRSFHR